MTGSRPGQHPLGIVREDSVERLDERTSVLKASAVER